MYRNDNPLRDLVNCYGWTARFEESASDGKITAWCEDALNNEFARQVFTDAESAREWAGKKLFPSS